MADSAPQPSSPRWKLTIENGAVFTETYFVTRDKLSIGRELDNDLALEDLKISRRHARIFQDNQQLVLEDLDSANGTLVNDEFVVEPTVLQAGDVISLGAYTLTVEPVELPQSLRSTAVGLPKMAPASSPPETKKRAGPWLLLLVGLALTLLVIAGGVLAGRWFFQWQQTGQTGQSEQNLQRESAAVAFSATADATASTAGPSIIISQSPGATSQVLVNQSVTVQAIASDSGGVSRLELWVDGLPVDSAESPVNQSAESLTGRFEWTPRLPGSYRLELRAYNETDQESIQPVTTVTALVTTETPTPPPPQTATITPLPPTATPTVAPSLTPTIVPPSPTPQPASLQVSVPLLNVRTGPGTQYPQIGQLAQGQTVSVVGQATGSQGQWWQIEQAALPGGQGWVAGDTNFVAAQNVADVPTVPIPPLPTAPPTATAAATALPTVTPQPSATPTVTPQVIRAPAGQTLLIVSNRSLINQPARLTLSGGKSVGGGREIDPPPGGEVRVTLEPDFYRALWSAPWRGFTRGVDFTAVPGKVMVMWVVPEDGVTNTEVYDELVINRNPPTATPVPTAAPTPLPGQPIAPPGKALLVVSNRSIENEFALLTISGGSFGGGQEFVLDGNTEIQLELDPADYRTIWHTPVNGGMNAGREFSVIPGEVIYGWIIPEKRQAFMEFPGQEPEQINN